MTLDEIERRLRETVAKATGGQWASHGVVGSHAELTGPGGYGSLGFLHEPDILGDYAVDRRFLDDLAHIAAACPDNLRMVLAELDRLRQRVAEQAQSLATTDAAFAEALAEKLAAEDRLFEELAGKPYDPSLLPFGVRARLAEREVERLRQQLADARATAFREAAAHLRSEADLYDKDGEPGPLSSQWGWRTIAETYRKQAAALERRAGEV